MYFVQITDLHLVRKPHHWLGNPESKTVERVEQVVQFINNLIPEPDVILITGDLIDDGKYETYQLLLELLQPLKKPYFIIPGNHDNPQEMQKVFKHLPKGDDIQYVVEDFPLRLIGLDTFVKGSEAGELNEKRLFWLENVLKDSAKPTLLFMHHPPAKTGYLFFDKIRCFSPYFEKLILSHFHIVGIVSGHYHNFCATTFGKKPCLIIPSVAPGVFIKHPQDETFTSLDFRPPELAIHQWEDNQLTTHLRKLFSTT